MKTELVITISNLSKENTDLFIDWITDRACDWYIEDEEDGDDEFEWNYEVRKIDDETAE